MVIDWSRMLEYFCLLTINTCSMLYESFALLSLDRYSPPHVKRKRKIEECASAFTVHVPVAEFYTKLFT